MEIVYLKKMFTFYFILCFFLLINQVGYSEENESSIIYVSNLGLGNFKTIQKGIDEAVSGDTIFVYNGTYFENVVVDKSIILIGENISNTIIDGRVTGNTVKVNADYVTIKNFTIQNSGLVYPNSGINLSSDFNVIENNFITDNFYGITLYFSSGNTIRNNTIQNDDHCGIYISYSKNNSILKNTIRNNNFNGVGLYYSSDDNIIEGNSFINNGFCGVNIRVSSNNNLINNNFSNNNIGIYLPNSPNTASDNTFVNNNVDIEKEFVLIENESFLIIAFAVFLGLIVFIFYLIIIKKRS